MKFIVLSCLLLERERETHTHTHTHTEAKTETDRDRQRQTDHAVTANELTWFFSSGTAIRIKTVPVVLSGTKALSSCMWTSFIVT